MRCLIQLNGLLLGFALIAQACNRDDARTSSMAAAGSVPKTEAGRGAAVAGAAPVPGSREDCNERASQASMALLTLLDNAASGCTRDTDCMEISIDTHCHAACGWLAASVHVAEIKAAISEQNAGVCAQFVAAGCEVTIPPCTPTLGTPTCSKSGECTLSQ